MPSMNSFTKNMLNSLPLSYQTGRLEATVISLKQKYKRLWLETEDTFPEFEKTYCYIKKKEIEAETTKFLDKLAEKHLSKNKNYQNNKFQEMDKQEEQDIEKFCLMAGLYMDKQFADGFDRATKIFMKKVKQFDPKLKPENIYQAMRNVWIMNSLQVLMDLEMSCSDSMFAYSMLYPYSDNINDSVLTSVEDKINMNRNFRNWLEGKSCPFENDIEQKIYMLVKIIEEEFDRRQFPGVFQSLLAIYNAQIKSLIQQKQQVTNNESDILDISLEKGGTSVLADGYLIKGILDEIQEDFCFGYGAFLQFADDIQDVRKDKENQHITLFSKLVGRRYLDDIANKLFNYMLKVLNLHLSSSAFSRLRELIIQNCFFMVLEAIGKNRQLYSKKYIQKIETHFPFTFSYFKTAKKRLKQMILTTDLN